MPPAEELYAKLVDHNPNAESAWFRLGYLRLERGDAEGGAQAFRHCLDKRADWPEAQVNLSIAYSKLGQYEDARRVLADLLARHPNHTDALQGLAEILRCIVCIQTGEWTPRLKDADEIDVVEQQLASSTYVDEAARDEAIAKAKQIEESAHHRATGGQI